MIALDMGEQLYSHPLDPIRANRCQHLVAGFVQIVAKKFIGEGSHGQARPIHMPPETQTIARRGHGADETMSAIAQLSQRLQSLCSVGRFIEPVALAFQNLIGADNEIARAT